MIAVLEWARNPKLPLLISSNGGCTAAARAIIDILQATPGATVIGTGSVASSAAGIFLAAERRLLTRNAVVLFHEPYAVYSREATEYAAGMMQCAASLELDRELFKELLLSAGNDLGYIYDRYVSGAGELLTADAMVKSGLAHGIVEGAEYAKILTGKRPAAKKKPTPRRPK